MLLKVFVDGQAISVTEGDTILDAARKAGKEVPTLCHIQGLIPEGACRICVVEVKGARGLMTACSTPVIENMEITTMSHNLFNVRRNILDLLLSNHRKGCFTCYRHGDCTFHRYCSEYGLVESTYPVEANFKPIDSSNKFYDFDPSKCILCRKCYRVCSSLQCTSALSIVDRGYITRVAAPFDVGLGNSACVSCGNCIAVCPTGALSPKKSTHISKTFMKKTLTTCPYCGVGCQLYLLTYNDKVVDIEPAKNGVNDGMLCVKGRFAFNFINHPDRLKKPYIRKKGQLMECSWDEALAAIAENFTRIMEEKGAKGFAGLASARCTNEDNYLFQKFMRTVAKTNNVDHCARLCHASSVTGLAVTLGSGAMTNSIDEITDMDCIFVIGSNTTETHPIIATKMKQAILKGAKIIVAEPREIELSKGADVFLQIQPGTNVALLNGLMKAVLDEGLQDTEFIEKRTEGFEELVNFLDTISVKDCAEICRVSEADMRKAARIYATSSKAGIFYAMGVTQFTTGTDGVMSVSNLALLCGHLGKMHSGVNPLRGQNNVQGACDMGALPGDYTGYQKVNDTQTNVKFERAWGCNLSKIPGLTVTEMFDSIDTGDVKFMYIMGENPLISDPDIKHVKQSLESVDFLVVQDIFMTETAQLADVVLPAVTYAEKKGTFTNTERRVQMVRPAIMKQGQCLEDWEIICKIANSLGQNWHYNSADEIMEEIALLTPIYGGISYKREDLSIKGLQWPCLDDKHEGTKYLHKEKFTRGKGRFVPTAYIPPAEMPDDEYPFFLTTGRILYQYHTRTMTGKTQAIEDIAGKSFVQINTITAKKLCVKNNEFVNVISRRGEVKVLAYISEDIAEDVVFMPFHYANGAANILTNRKLDNVAKIPELKVCAVRLEAYE